MQAVVLGGLQDGSNPAVAVNIRPAGTGQIPQRAFFMFEVGSSASRKVRSGR